MTTHPEAAMTREQMLEEAAERAARLLLDAETICHAVSNRGGPTYRNMAEAFKQGRDQCKAALAPTRQEPAPAADAEEVARQIYDDMQEDNSHEQNVAVIVDALRRYAGDGGVTWQPIETAPRDGSIILIDSKLDEPTWLPFVARLIEGPYTFPPGTVWTRAPARAKPGEKGGAR